MEKLIFYTSISFLFISIFSNDVSAQLSSIDSIQIELQKEKGHVIDEQLKKITEINGIEIQKKEIQNKLLAANSKRKKSKQRVKKLEAELSKINFELKKQKEIKKSLGEKLESIDAEFNAYKSRAEEDIAYWTNVAKEYEKKAKARMIAIQSYQDSIAVLIDKISELNKEVEVLEGRNFIMETELEKVNRENAVLRLQQQMARAVYEINLSRSTNNNLVDLQLSTGFDWINTQNYSLNHPQFVRIEISPHFMIYQHDNRESGISMTLESGFKLDNAGLTSDILHHTTINSTHNFKLKLRDDDGKFRIFKKKKFSYRFKVKIYLAYENEDGKILPLDGFTEGYIFITNKGKNATFELPNKQ